MKCKLFLNSVSLIIVNIAFLNNINFASAQIKTTQAANIKNTSQINNNTVIDAQKAIDRLNFSDLSSKPQATIQSVRKVIIDIQAPNQNQLVLRVQVNRSGDVSTIGKVLISKHYLNYRSPRSRNEVINNIRKALNTSVDSAIANNPRSYKLTGDSYYKY
ncbi:MAG: hypothetical protein AAFQ91_04630 [Cyanobacteria bacterium J06621_15]